ncbi:MAG: hypothetical protein ACD_71C00179G0017 [uncultured bacterium (gcode 4)]|uniref:Uncharacterized protein n=1 Tax=uncultured bacterium (gcode 4) TaxID=1234023 RepID=K1Z452_9BACT|nr:MAG: hypothetical protein ACD_71C00179G0017 [uncultured bacterium (gcode 4)]
MATPEEVSAKINIWEAKHLAKFEDVDAFLSEQEALVLEYYRKKWNGRTLEEFKAHLKAEFERYKRILPTINHEDQHDILQELIDNIAIPYSKLMYFGEVIPSWAVEKEDEMEKKFPIMKIVRWIVAKIKGK